jgi:hypothetical protein
MITQKSLCLKVSRLHLLALLMGNIKIRLWITGGMIRQGETEALGEKPVSAALCPP